MTWAERQFFCIIQWPESFAAQRYTKVEKQQNYWPWLLTPSA